ncbi:hypothetical protein JHW43_006831 [Diplocarpon mali]|nr:hypothetical protein JHW43_006831 [Diplocarpon mali]
MARGHTDPEFPQLQALGLKTHDIIGDGNCQPRSLSDQIYGDQTHHLEIRAKIIEEMRRNKRDYEVFCLPEPRANPVRSSRKMAATIAVAPVLNFDQHLLKLSRPGEWLDHPQLAAFAKAYNMDVTVHQKNISRVIMADERAGAPSCRMLHIARHNWDHYSSVRSIKTGLPLSSLEPEIKGHRANSTTASLGDAPVPRAEKDAELARPPSGASNSSPETSQEGSIQNLRKRSRSELSLAGTPDDLVVPAEKRRRVEAKTANPSKPATPKVSSRDSIKLVGTSEKRCRDNEPEAKDRASKRTKLPEPAVAPRRRLVKGLRPRIPSEHGDSEDEYVRGPEGRKIILPGVEYAPSIEEHPEPETFSAPVQHKVKEVVPNKYNLKSARKHSSQLPRASSSAPRLNPKSANIPSTPAARGKDLLGIKSRMPNAPPRASRPIPRPLASPASSQPLSQSRGLPAKSASSIANGEQKRPPRPSTLPPRPASLPRKPSPGAAWNGNQNCLGTKTRVEKKATPCRNESPSATGRRSHGVHSKSSLQQDREWREFVTPPHHSVPWCVQDTDRLGAHSGNLPNTSRRGAQAHLQAMSVSRRDTIRQVTMEESRSRPDHNPAAASVTLPAEA